jgi:hypothetical protein
MLKSPSHSRTLEMYNTNKHKDWKKWLEYKNILNNQGKQGIVGILKDKNDDEYVFKMSQYINYLAEHESIIMKGLSKITEYCPHFCKMIGMISCEVDPKNRKKGNPFQIEGKYPIEKDVLLIEYIDKSCKFSNYIRSSKIHEDILYSTIKQVLLAVNIAQKKKQFSHYDLHSYNIMMKKCYKDLVFLYILDDDTQICVPTYGHYPVIIDYGFSYIKDMNGGPLWPSLAHTDVGFMSDRFDWVADPKLFLVTVSSEIRNKRKSRKSKKLRHITKNIFGNLKIDWDSGWDNVDKKGASDYLTELLQEYNHESNLFDNYDHYCIDLIQSLIILPLQEYNYENIHISYCAFLEEFVKIEQEIGNPFYNLYILKGIIDFAREVRIDYIHDDSRDKAIEYFRQNIYERINKVARFCRPKNINFEIMLCSLYEFSKKMEGFLYDIMFMKVARKNKEYTKMPLQNIEQILGVIEINLPDKYIYNQNTKIIIIDSTKELSDIFDIDSIYLDEINNTHSMAKGSLLYKLYLESKNKI